MVDACLHIAYIHIEHPPPLVPMALAFDFPYVITLLLLPIMKFADIKSTPVATLIVVCPNIKYRFPAFNIISAIGDSAPYIDLAFPSLYNISLLYHIAN